MTKPTAVSRKVTDFTPDAKNANKGTVRGLAMLEDSLRDFGAGRSILVDKRGNVIAGNKTLQSAVDIGLDNAIVVPTDGTQLVVVQRTDIEIDDPKGRALAIADNRVSEIDLSWSPEVLGELLTDGVDLARFFDDDELAALLSSVAEEPTPPEDFNSYDENIETQYCCPKCGYKWSGKPNAEQ